MKCCEFAFSPGAENTLCGRPLEGEKEVDASLEERFFSVRSVPRRHRRENGCYTFRIPACVMQRKLVRLLR